MTPLATPDFQTIIARRDPRYDGRFYFGVKTTGIYCRPICPAQPKPEHIVIFKSLSEAEKSGYRPCLRCHPDSAPGHRLWDGTITTVSRALRLLHDSTEDELTLGRLAANLGITDRHLRRLFDDHLGASPIEILITRRLHFAKQAIRETKTSITTIALASGFKSIRRFNEAFKTRFSQSPSAFRKAHPAASHADRLTLRIPIRAPYDWLTTISYLKRHETYGIEYIEDHTYQRFIPRKKSFGSIRVSPMNKGTFLKAEFTDIPLKDIPPILARLKHAFDTDHNPAHLPASKSILPNGIRVPGSFDPFETAIAIILSQLVSTAQAKTNLKTLVQLFGRKLGTEGAKEVYAFPAPKVLAYARVEKVGLTRGKAGAIRALSRAVARGTLDFHLHRDFSEVSERLLKIKGIGPWTAMMIRMRCLQDPDAFPVTDLVIQKAIKKLGINPTAWASARAYLTHCLWRDHNS